MQQNAILEKKEASGLAVIPTSEPETQDTNTQAQY